MKYLLSDYHSKSPKTYFNRNILYADAGIVLIGATYAHTSSAFGGLLTSR